ncbi:MAG: archease [Proteobacteria bacterium]|nr:archease [Pseudomonadota bacterium]
MIKSFRFVNHTADVGVIVWGKSLPELFQHAAESFFHILTEPETIKEIEARTILVRANGIEELLVAWLNEFLFLFEAERLLFRQFVVEQLDSHYLKATAKGERYAEGRHPIKGVIKAVTYHQLRIEEKEGIWKTQIIYDL